jgi:uncharacterized protein (TIGR00251 family)
LRAPRHRSFRLKDKTLITEDTGKHREGTLVYFHESAGGTTFVIKVHPRANKNAITGEVGDALKLSLTVPPTEGRANEACIEFFAKLLKVPRSSVTIASGHSSRNKTIRVAGMSSARVQARIGM